MNSDNLYAQSQSETNLDLLTSYNDYAPEKIVNSANDERKKQLVVDDINDIRLNIIVEDYTQILSTCSHCNKNIFAYEIMIELDAHFYHKDCYKCKCCNEKFYLEEIKFSPNKPIQSQDGSLYCLNDFIRSLKCLICNKNFDTDSRIFELNSDVLTCESNRLTHVECAKCQTCDELIQASSEYLLEKCLNETISLDCKRCSIKKFNESNTMMHSKNKKVFTSNNRLSSRQKELLATKILSNNIELGTNKILTETSEIIKYLANEIKCSKKSLVYYLNKHIKKANDKQSEIIESDLDSTAFKNVMYSNKSNIKSIKSTPLKTMLDDLNKLDKILAPNKFPFGQIDGRKNAEIIPNNKSIKENQIKI